MRMVAGALLLFLLAAFPAAGGAEEPVERESEYEMEASEAWRQPGFRVELRLGRDNLSGVRHAPDAGGFAFSVSPGIRLSEHFTLSAGLRYTALYGDVWGLRYGATADLTWHAWKGGFLAAGFGHAGLVAESRDWSRFQSCDGYGVVALARTGWLFPLGEVFATGPVLQWDHQWIYCSDRPLAESPIWQHHTLHFSWSLAWR